MTTHLTAIIKLLENSHLFKTLDEAGRKEMEGMAEAIDIKPGHIIIQEGTDGDSFCVLLSGKVQVSAIKNGKQVNLAELGRGAVLGEVALLTGEPRTATVVALEATSLVQFREPGINKILEAYPKVKELLVRVLVHRAKDTIDKLSKELTVS